MAVKTTRAEFNRSKARLFKAADALDETIYDESVVPETIDQAQRDNEAVADMQARMRARYGIEAATGRAEQGHATRQSLADAMAVLGAANNAQLAQEDQQYAARVTKANLGQGLKGMSMENLMNGYAAHQQRKAKGRDNRASGVGGLLQTGVTLGAAAFLGGV